MTDAASTVPGNDAPAAPAHRSSGASPFARNRWARATNRGYGDAMARGLELALTLLVMVGFGWIADRIFGTEPMFIIVFSVLGFAGITVKLWLGYDLEMRKQEEGAVWNRGAEKAS